MSFKVKDYFFKKAKKENFVARSIFKLEEIDQKLKLLRAGQHVLDLGAAPGSWSQYISKKIGPTGFLVSIDLKDMQTTLPNALFLKTSIFDVDWETLSHTHQFKPSFDCVCSDMAPHTTGIKITDQARSYELCEKGLAVANAVLKRNGHYVCKLFQSEFYKPFEKQLKEMFEQVTCVRPDSTRKTSTEVFLVGLRKRTAPLLS